VVERWRPDPVQQELLTALLHPDDDLAVAAWQRWQTKTDLQQIDLGSQRLVPLLHDRLSRLSIRHGQEPRYRAVHRYWWLRNATQIKRLSEVLVALSDAGIDQRVLMGGMALIGDIYPSQALRPTFDSDVLVRSDDVPVAIGALARLGFAPTNDSVRAMDQPWIASLARRQPGIRIRDSQIGRIHLWWSPAGAEGRADDMMARAVSPRSKELPARVLAPVDQLLQTCSQTLCRSDFRPLWWVVDATLMLRGHSFDGTQLTVLARQRRLTLPIAAMLTYLDDAFDAPMPTGAISHLLAAPFDQKDRSGHLARIDPRLARSWGRVFGVLSQYLQHRRVSPEGSFLEFVSVAKNRPLLPPAKPDAAAPDSTLM